jgi:hypothetical protein
VRKVQARPGSGQDTGQDRMGEKVKGQVEVEVLAVYDAVSFFVSR